MRLAEQRSAVSQAQSALLGAGRDPRIHLADRLLDQVHRVHAVPALVGNCQLKLTIGSVEIGARIEHVALNGERGTARQRTDEHTTPERGREADTRNSDVGHWIYILFSRPRTDRGGALIGISQ